MANSISFVSMGKPPSYPTAEASKKEKEAWNSCTFQDVPEEEHFYNLQGITFPGLDKVVRSESTVTRKILWALVFVTCIGVICMQVTDRVRYYYAMPVNMYMRTIKNQSMVVPRITLCHSDTMKQDLIRTMRQDLARSLNKTLKHVTLYDLLLVTENITQLWEKVAYQFDDMVFNCKLKKYPCEDLGVWRSIATVSGICYTYDTNETLTSPGKMNGVRITLKEKTKDANQQVNPEAKWRILIHSPNEDPRAEIMTRGVILGQSASADIRMRLRRYEWANSAKRPCDDVSFVNCFLDCLGDTIYKGVGCRLPFMDNTQWPLCPTPDLYRKADGLRGLLVAKAGLNCSCVPECKLETFELSVDSMPYSDKDKSQVKIFYDDFVYDQYHEAPAYNIVSMLCDIGGSLGLFLGASVLSFVELGDTLVATIQKRYFKKVVKERSRGTTDDASKC